MHGCFGVRARLAIICFGAMLSGCADAAVDQARADASNALADASTARAQASAAWAEASAARAAAAACDQRVEQAEKDAADARSTVSAMSSRLDKLEADAKSARICHAKPHTPKPGAPVILMTADGMKINGALLPTKPTRSDVEKVIGKASRIEDHLHIYDKLGLVVWVEGEGKVTQVSLYLAETGYFYQPAETFVGRAELEGAAVHVKRTALTKELGPGITYYADVNAEGCLASAGIGFSHD